MFDFTILYLKTIKKSKQKLPYLQNNVRFCNKFTLTSVKIYIAGYNPQT